MEALSLPQIDYDFWKEKNSYYSSKKLDNQTIRGIKTAQKTGLLNSVIDDDGNILIKLAPLPFHKFKNPSCFIGIAASSRHHPNGRRSVWKDV